MSLEVCVLGSGSGGNSTVVRAGRGAILIDAGFGPRATAHRLIGTGVEVAQIRAICLTHLDRDHFNYNWLATLVKYQIPVFCHEGRREELQRNMRLFAGGREKMVEAMELIRTFDATFEPAPDFQLQPVFLRHDAEGSHGFLVESGGYRLGYATDMGRVPPELIELFCGVHVLALESNYDPEMEKNSERPWYLKQRIMGGSGHLSNEEAFAAVRAILDFTEARHGPEQLPRHIVLLHRSRECNCPKIVRQLFATDPRIHPVLTLADQLERTPWLRAHTSDRASTEQYLLAWS